MNRLFACLVVLAACAGLAAPTQAASHLEKHIWLSGPNYDGVVPACDEPAALGRIASRFAEKERTFWKSDLRIADFGQVRQIAFRPWGQAFIPRRYCTARVVLSSGRKTVVHYSIGEDMGMIGHSWGVEWCVVGADRNWSYNPACKMARP
jgi:hypothetical protein